MDQRPLRAGDSVDDYCPRERRVTRHAIVAIAEDVIRQTRCSTCDAEHEYKGAKMPRPRKKAPDIVAPVTPMSNGSGNGHGAVAAAATAVPVEPEPAPMAAMAADVAPAEPAHSDGNGKAEDLWVGHRPLIRATLPRTEGDPPPIPRPIPEFTMHQRHGRGGQGFRQGQWQDRNGNGPSGFGHGNGQGRGPQQPGPGGGRSRHRRSKSRRPR